MSCVLRDTLIDEFLQQQTRNHIQRLKNALALVGSGAERRHLHVAVIEQIIHVFNRRGVRQIALVVLDDIGDFPEIEFQRAQIVYEVLKALEEARNAKQIGSSLEAKVILTADSQTTRFLIDYFDQLRYIFIVSQVELHEGDAIEVEIQKADGQKCERCWNYSIRVGEFEEYPTVCERCYEALAEIERGRRLNLQRGFSKVKEYIE